MIDWRTYAGTKAPKFSGEFFQYLIDDAAKMKSITLVVPDAAYDSFVADAGWSKLNIKKVSGDVAVDLVATQAISVAQQDAFFVLSGLEVGATYFLYELSGAIVEQGVVPSSGCISVSKSGAVRVFRLGSQSIKLL